MPNPFAYKKPGDRLTHSAAAHNAFVDSAKAHAERGSREGAGQSTPSHLPVSANYVQIVNQANVMIPIYSVVGIEKPVFVPLTSDNAEAMFRFNTVQKAVTTNLALHNTYGRFGVAVEPIPVGKVGWVLIGGSHSVEMSFPDDATYTHATLPTGVGPLEADEDGIVNISWHDTDPTGENLRWATIIVSGAPNDDRPVRMQVQEIGDNFLNCKTWDGTTLGDTIIVVAKAWTLRHDYTLYYGLTGLTTVNAEEVIASNGVDDDETWITTPRYNVGQNINAHKVNGGTGIAGVDYIHEDGREFAVPDAVE